MSAPGEKHRDLVCETLETVHPLDVEPGKQLAIGQCRQRLTSSAALALVHRGSVLILGQRPGTAIKRARELAKMRALVQADPLLDALYHVVQAEQGADGPPVECLRHGVAYLSAGLSPQLCWLIEELIRMGLLTLVCGTPTLAEEVLLPMATVIVETVCGETAGEHTSQALWNRAG